MSSSFQGIRFNILGLHNFNPSPPNPYTILRSTLMFVNGWRREAKEWGGTAPRALFLSLSPAKGLLRTSGTLCS